MSFARSAGSASPPTSAVSRRSEEEDVAAAVVVLAPPPPARFKSPRHVVGVACITLTFASAMSARNASGSPAVSFDAITHTPPTSAGRNSSRPAMSKHTVVTAHRRVFASTPPSLNSSAMPPRKLSRLRCVTCTPFGRPVLPLVKMTYARSEDRALARRAETRREMDARLPKPKPRPRASSSSSSSPFSGPFYTSERRGGVQRRR